MAETTINIDVAPIFSVPLAVTELAEAAAINAELEPLLLSRERPEFANPVPSPLLTRNVFESAPGILQWQDAPMVKLRAALMMIVGRVVGELSAFTAQELTSIVGANQTRFHVTRHGGAIPPHNQPMASWSTIYCVNPGDETPDFPDSALLRILDTRMAACSYVDAANARWRSPFGFGHATVKLRAGHIVLLPAYLLREVTTYLGQRPRITISSTFTFARRNEAPDTGQATANPS
jgi:hypothetical protein